MNSKMALAALLLLPLCVEAFEIKGYSAGVDVTAIDVSGCKPLSNADSGIPGFSCNTTLGGDSAEMRIMVFDGKVVGLIFRVQNGQMQPVLDALSEKYGRPSKSNRYIEDYNWSQSGRTLSIKEDRLTRGYRLLTLDWPLFKKAQDAAKEKVKGDL